MECVLEDKKMECVLEDKKMECVLEVEKGEREWVLGEKGESG
jgi:hypothetical protein